mmetsp:Transcript_541/g.1365  ORF Transcript_541/g.1365 Transcript_541/m.1365 type:complete len:740 (+) Transcript_541:414-2633(+)|eukprot:CAMPEP_0171574198 /NCGR_PEP_ID=MMETSP0961-20121227/5210_1 /TAXON_ID=87120 /ORGANISM="Aurantiochytrium limacinum, Strain ATCCMYA-1381" /LENGTH=739 /DNA_ID=CAMNT_0012129459 /DNA_START=396 /DNA_END=2615 /DNA_ORIENTATION=-
MSEPIEVATTNSSNYFADSAASSTKNVADTGTGNNISTQELELLGSEDLGVPRPSRQPTTKQCDVEGCKGWKALGGKCTTHGGGKRCEIEGCQHLSQGNGLCISHGGGHRCKQPGCARSARSGFDHCVSHGAVTKRCAKPGCEKSAQRGGLCIRHGGGKRCSHPGCEKAARGSFKVCVAHGARERRCSEDQCTNKALKGGRCKRHGGGNRCQHPSCDKAAESRSKWCISHGAPGRRCKIDDCKKHAMRGGFCIAHGGGRRCANLTCVRSAVSGSNLCISHGAPKSICKERGCDQLNAGGGYCKLHGGGRCKMEGCWKIRQRSTGFCQRHQQDSVDAIDAYDDPDPSTLAKSNSQFNETEHLQLPHHPNEQDRDGVDVHRNAFDEHESHQIHNATASSSNSSTSTSIRTTHQLTNADIATSSSYFISCARRDTVQDVDSSISGVHSELNEFAVNQSHVPRELPHNNGNAPRFTDTDNAHIDESIQSDLNQSARVSGLHSIQQSHEVVTEHERFSHDHHDHIHLPLADDEDEGLHVDHPSGRRGFSKSNGVVEPLESVGESAINWAETFDEDSSAEKRDPGSSKQHAPISHQQIYDDGRNTGGHRERERKQSRVTGNADGTVPTSTSIHCEMSMNATSPSRRIAHKRDAQAEVDDEETKEENLGLLVAAAASDQLRDGDVNADDINLKRPGSGPSLKRNIEIEAEAENGTIHNAPPPVTKRHRGSNFHQEVQRNSSPSNVV